MDIKNGLIIYGPDFCKKCNMRAIEIFDYFNSPMGYHNVAKDYMKGEPNKFAIMQRKTIYKMRCRNCGTTYNIRWDRGYPVPDLYTENESNRAFMIQYKNLAHEENPRLARIRKRKEAKEMKARRKKK